LNTKFFTYTFSDAVAILLHEWTHIYGYDGSRMFSDALTEIIAIILKNRKLDAVFASFEDKWDSFVDKIKKERKEIEDEINIDNILEKLTKEQLANMLKDIPENDLKNLIKKWGNME
jgi:hypothetical protein